MPPPVVVVDRGSDEPVYAQIARRIREAIAGGDLAPGSALPSVRTLASDLGVNLNTVARAYRMLEDEGFVALRERTGAEVAPPARRADAAAREALLGQLGTLLARMRQAGLTASEIERAVARETAAWRKP